MRNQLKNLWIWFRAKYIKARWFRIGSDFILYFLLTLLLGERDFWKLISGALVITLIQEVIIHPLLVAQNKLYK